MLAIEYGKYILVDLVVVCYTTGVGEIENFVVI